MFSPVQTTTQAFNFAPSLGEIVLSAFGRIQVRPAEITQSHMFTARMAANLLLSEWSNLQPNLWEVGLQSVPLIAGSATYSVTAETVMILDMYITYGTPPIDRYINPVSRSEYAAISNKTAQGFPSQFWFDRLISPTITFYLTPDGAFPYVAKFYSVRQTQDADFANGLNVEVTYRHLEAYSAGLAWKLAETYQPALEDKLFARYQRAWNIASTQDTENVAMALVPGTSGYFR